jgi:hypothetical protein
VTLNASSPVSSEPAGSHFEGQVGAFYLRSLLSGAEPRGLPGMLIDRIELQRASEGRPLDDVIVHVHDTLGGPAVLEIQIKRSITFAPSDQVFRKVVGHMIERLNREIKRRTRVASLFPNEASLLRLISAILIEISEEWETSKKYLTLEYDQLPN